MPADVRQVSVDIGGTHIRMLKGGAGAPLVILHGTEGCQGWLRYAQALAEQFTVYVPSHPGFDGSERPAWLNTIPTTHHAFSKLMLVDAAGIKPQVDEITDLFILSPAQITQLTFHDPQQAPEYDMLYGGTRTPAHQENAIKNREMAVRLTWKPYMHDPRLPSLLARVHIPTCIVWGRQDHIIPVECGELYRQAIPGAELVVLDNCGHMPQVEQPEAFVRLARQFLG